MVSKYYCGAFEILETGGWEGALTWRYHVCIGYLISVFLAYAAFLSRSVKLHHGCIVLFDVTSFRGGTLYFFGYGGGYVCKLLLRCSDDYYSSICCVRWWQSLREVFILRDRFEYYYEIKAGGWWCRCRSEDINTIVLCTPRIGVISSQPISPYHLVYRDDVWGKWGVKMVDGWMDSWGKGCCIEPRWKKGTDVIA